jgi:hypothetical protein
VQKLGEAMRASNSPDLWYGRLGYAFAGETTAQKACNLTRENDSCRAASCIRRGALRDIYGRISPEYRQCSSRSAGTADSGRSDLDSASGEIMAANGEIFASDPENLVPRPQSHLTRQGATSKATKLA